jgi:hypothetical protein
MKPGASSRVGADRRLLALLAALFAVIVLAVPGPAVAASPSLGWFSGHDDAGGSLRFHVHGSASGARALDLTTYDPADHDEFGRQDDFERTVIRGDGRFGTCAFEPVNDVFFREYCIYGQFDATDHAAGTIRISIAAGGQRWPKPLATYRWTAEL